MTNWLYRKIGEFLKDAVYAANDGIITTFAVVAGVVGASLDPIIIVVLGFANLFADGLSMAGGNYLGTKSEKDLYTKERNRHEKVLRGNKGAYRIHVIKFLKNKGYSQEGAGDIADRILDNNRFALDFVMHEELGLVEQKDTQAIRGAAVTLVSFMAAGLIPIIPFIFLGSSENAFLFASIFTGMALFGVGAARSIYTERSWILAGLEMFLIGGIAATAAYGIGFLISQILG